MSQHQKLLLGLTALQTLAYVVATAYMMWRDFKQSEFIADLLDRVMARDYQSYAATRPNQPARPPRRVPNDEDLARLEKQRAGLTA